MQPIQTMNDILDFAIQQETKAFEFYHNLAKQAEKDSLRRVLDGFAAEELEHRLRLEAVKNGELGFVACEEVGTLNIAETLKEIGAKPDMSYKDLLEVAMRRELLAYRTYLTMSMASQKAELKQLFEQLAREEAEHKLRLEIEYDLLTF